MAVAFIRATYAEESAIKRLFGNLFGASAFYITVSDKDKTQFQPFHKTCRLILGILVDTWSVAMQYSSPSYTSTKLHLHPNHAQC